MWCRHVPWPRLPEAEKSALLGPPGPYMHLMVHEWTLAYSHPASMAPVPPLC